MTKTDDRVVLGNRLRSAREYRGYSQEDVATYLRIARSAVSLIESGDRRLDAIELAKLAKLFDCQVGELTGEAPGTDVNNTSIQLVARLAASLTEEDREEVVRFAQFLHSRRARSE